VEDTGREEIGPLVPVALLWSRPVMQFITRASLARRHESAHFAAKYSLVLMELVLPSVSTTIIEASLCSSFDHGERYLREELTTSCTSASRRAWEIYTSLCFLLYPIGIPALLFTLLYLNRNEIRPVLEVMRDHDARGEDHAGEEQLARQGSATISEMMLELSAKRRRPSVVARSTRSAWLMTKLDCYKPSAWWIHPVLLVLRLSQSSFLACFETQTTLAAGASVVAIAGVGISSASAPYRRPSDNTNFVQLQSVIFLWAFTMLIRSAGLCNSRGSTVAIGIFLVIVTVGAVIRSLSFAYRELDPRAITQIVRDDAAKKKKGQRSFKKGDVIVRASGQNSRTVMDAQDFAEHFEQAPGSAAPAEDGFVAYREAGKVWAHELSKDEATTHFPAGKFISAGTASTVKPGDVLLMPYPGGGALYRLGKSSFERKYASVLALDAAGRAPAHHIPSQAETLVHWESKLKANGSIYRKTVHVHAKLADDDGTVETVVGGLCEARTPYLKGDYIVVGSRGGQYAMAAIDFFARYDPSNSEPASDQALAEEGFSLYRPKGMVWALELSDDDLQHFFPARQFTGKWGTPVSVEPTDYLVSPYPTGGEIYAIKHNLFQTSYVRHVASDYVPSEKSSLDYWGGVLRQDARVCTKTAIFYAKVADADGTLGEMSAFITDEEDADISPRASQDKLAVPSSPSEIELSTVESGIALVPMNPADGRLPETDERERQPDSNSSHAIDGVAGSSCTVS